MPSAFTWRTWNGSTRADWPRTPAASRIQILDQLRVERDQSAVGIAFRVQQSVKPVADADHLPSQFARRQSRSHDHGIHPRDVAGAHIDSNASEETGMAYFGSHCTPHLPAVCVQIHLSYDFRAEVHPEAAVRYGVARVPRRTGRVEFQHLPKACSVRAMISFCTPGCSLVKNALKPATRTTRSRYFSGCFCASLRCWCPAR